MRVVGTLSAALVIMLVACSTTPEKSPEQAGADEATADRVYVALNDNPVFYFRDVDVSVDDGMATLSGYVWTIDALYSAQQIARSVPGITGVVNRMELERQASRGGADGGGAQ